MPGTRSKPVALDLRASRETACDRWNELWNRAGDRVAAPERGDEMKDAIDLTERLRALLEEHGATALLRAISASSRGIAEKADDQVTWLNASLAADVAAESLENGCGFAENEDEEDETSDDDDPDDTPNETSAPEPAGAARPDRAPTPNEGASMMKRDIPTPANVTHWRVQRRVDGADNQAMSWGTNGVMLEQFPIRDLSYDTIRSRWGAGKYVIYWFGPRDGENRSKILPMGGGIKVHLVDPPAEAPAPPRSEVPAASGSSSELLAALSALRPPNPSTTPPVGGGTDMAVVLQVLAFMEDSRERQARAAEARLQAEREIMMERERLASKERIAQLEANAHAAARGGGRGVDTEALAEVIGRKVQEVIEGSGDDDDSAALATRPSDVATIANALKETIAPLVTMFIQNAMTKPSGNGSNGSN